MNKATEGTSLEGKIIIKLVVDQNYYNNMRSGNADLALTAWGGASFDPYNTLWCYSVPAAKHEFGFNPMSETLSIDIGGKTVTIGGMCKGSGMIEPNMATMLGFITTDCAIERPLLEKALKEAVYDSFNMICVDGDMSTNDTVLIMANAEAGNDLITAENEDYLKFREAVFYITRELAIACADDGEGATKLISDGCVLISQHADSMGSPTACENAGVPNSSYNGPTDNACPETYISYCKIDWTPYFTDSITK